MLYHFFNHIDQEYDVFGAGVFQYISFRAGLAVLISLLITITFGQRLINLLKAFQLGESIRDLGLNGQMEKQGTPTLGGIIILLGILIPTFLFANLTNIYILLLTVSQ